MDSEKKQTRLLIVDDERDILSSLEALLNAIEQTWIVETALGGPAALKLIAESKFDLIISDYRMPEMDGLEFMREVRKQSNSIPLVLMTAFPDLKIAIEAINEVGIQNFFTKPLDPDEIIEVLRDIVNKTDRSSQRDRAFARAMALAGRKP